MDTDPHEISHPQRGHHGIGIAVAEVRIAEGLKNRCHD